MEIKIKNYQEPKFLQEGGPIEEQAPVEEAPAEGGDLGMELLLAACQLALQTLDCNIAMLVCQVLIQMAGGGAPAEALGEPVYRKGGILSRRIK